jgi:hypothetical protein
MKLLESVVLDKKVRSSINYAKARCAIESDRLDFPNRASMRRAKLTVVEFLGGTKKDNSVVFSDGSKALF